MPWSINPDTPDLGLKVLRVSEETGVVSLIVRHNGVAAPHYHLGAADFMVLSGNIGYRAGPPQGYGPGTWFYEPAGARHDATQRIGEDDLIYTAGTELVRNEFPHDASLLAWAPLGSEGAVL